jgi:hypothetical protein
MVTIFIQKIRKIKGHFEGYATISKSSSYTLKNFTIMVLSFFEDFSSSNQIQFFVTRMSKKRRLR